MNTAVAQDIDIEWLSSVWSGKTYMAAPSVPCYRTAATPLHVPSDSLVAASVLCNAAGTSQGLEVPHGMPHGPSIEFFRANFGLHKVPSTRPPVGREVIAQVMSPRLLEKS